MPSYKSTLECDWLLSAQRIDVWKFDLYQSADSGWILSCDEQNQANRFYFDKHRIRYALAHTRLRKILSRYLHCQPLEINFDKQPYGKPFIVGKSLEFNLSHSGDHALLAISQKMPLGIDLECFSGRSFQGIAQHMFSENECEQLMTSPGSLAPLCFFSIWSQKEAFIKACGLGLRYPTKDFTVQAFHSEPYLVEDSLHQRQWYLYPFSYAPAVSAALCYAADCTDINFYQWTKFSNENSHF